MNESNALEALLGIIPAITGCNYSTGGSPDDIDSQNKEVDFILIPDSGSFPKLAIEHTVVEAYRGQKTYIDRSYKIVKEIDLKCKASLPSNRFFGLVLPPNLVDLLQRKEIDRFVEFITPWVIDTARLLKVDDYKATKYAGYEILLLCSGSIPEINGTVGRMPGSPKDQKDLVAQSLWLSIEHGIGKFLKYKQQGYDCVLALENISGIAHPSTLVEIAKDSQKRSFIELIDFVIVFASNDDRMIVGNVWKERQTLYDPVPFNRRFHKVGGKWSPLE
jgi:hypothetical protein